MRNFKDFTRAIAGIATALKGINTVVDNIPVSSGGGSSFNYKAGEEHEIGVWVDGTTPLYEYVYYDEGLTQMTNYYKDLPADADPKTAWIDKAVFFGPERTRRAWYADSGDFAADLVFNTQASNQIYYLARNLGTGTYNALIVLRYTKTSV